MNSESSMYLIVDPRDIECGICYQSYSQTTNQAMLLPCGHSICSTCLPNISSCPHCRKAFTQTPAKNVLVASFIEKDSQAKKCTIHKKPKDYFSNKLKRLVCCDCLLEEHKEEFQPIQKIESKVREIKEQRKTINMKRQETQLKIQESLNKRRENLDNVVDILLEEELAYIFSLKKKIKSILEVCSFTDEDRFEHQLLAEDLSKHEEKTQEMLEKWDDNKQQDEDMAAKILDSSLEIKGYMEKYEDKEKEILENIQEEEKLLEKTIQESKYCHDPRTINMRELLEKLQHKTQAELNPKHSATISTDYLLRTLKDYGIQYDYRSSEQPIILKENAFFTNLNKFYPKFFECSLEKLHLSCINLSDSRFKMLCEILLNIQNLSDLNITFENISLEVAELLSNFVLQSKTLQKFSTKLPLLNGLHDPFEKFVQMTFPLKNLSTLDINYSANDTSISFQQSPSQPSQALKECSMRFSRRNLMLHFATSVILPNLNFYKSIQKIQLSFAKDVIYARFLQDLCQILRNLDTLQEFDLGLANAWQLKNHGLAGQISHLLSIKRSLTKVNLFLTGKALSKEKVFDDLFYPHQRFDVPADHQLEEFTLTLMRCEELNIQKMVGFLENFPKLKKLTLRMNQVNLPLTKITGLLKEIPHLKSLTSLEIVCRGFMELNQQQKVYLEICKSRLPTSIVQPKIVFEGLMAHHVPDYVEIGPEDGRENEGHNEEDNDEAYNNFQRDI